MSSLFARCAIPVGVAAFFGSMSAISIGEAGYSGSIHMGGSAFKGGAIHMCGGDVGKFHTNPGGKYTYRNYGSKFHTNPGGKYVYRGYGSKFHTNPGGKYVYRGWSGTPR